jgi:site-specific recombinase XerD
VKQKNIDLLVDEAIKYLKKQSYSKISLYHYSRIWRKLLKYAHEKQTKYYSMEFGLEFFYHLTGLDATVKPNKRDLHKLRPLKVLNDLTHGNEIKRKYVFKKPVIPESFVEVLEQYRKYLLQKSQKERTIETKLSRIRIFLNYLERHSVQLLDVEFKTIANFYQFLSTEYATNGRSNIQFTLRDFLVFAERINVVKEGTSKLITTIYSNKHERLPSTYSVEEINKILSVIDRSTKYGKRDYTILLFAIQLGMRSSDICNLKLNGIHLEERRVTFRQEKTGITENLPITELMVYALGDYLKNSRPITESALLFVHMNANPNRGYTVTALYAIINKYMKKAEINITGKRHGIHAMRHSLSSNLIKSGTSLPVISGILGHSSTEITTRYLWMDTEQLRKLSLEVPYEE